MATFLDVTLIGGAKVIFTFLLVFVIVWGLLTWIKPFGAKGPMATVVPSRGMLGAALVISPTPSAHSQAALAWEVAASPAPASRARPASLALAGGNDMAPCLPLYEALATGEGTVGLSLGTGLLLRLGVSRVEA